jgi:radical SAM superfamily enzyme YgiQ (UPF0313 family)
MQVVLLTTGTDNLRFLRYLGPYQISWWIRENGYETQVLDFLMWMTPEERLSLFKKYITSETKIVAFAPFGYLIYKVPGILKPLLDILEEIKQHFPWVKIVIGGVFVRNFLRSKVYNKLSFKVDAVFEGEGEDSFLEYCDYIFQKSSKFPAFKLQDGLKVIFPTKTYNIQNCRMRYHERDFILPGEALPIEFSRGCIFKCKFCQYPNLGKDKDDFNRSVANIVDTIIYNYENFGTTDYYVADDTFNSHRDRTINLHKELTKLPFKINFVGWTRLDLLDIWPEQQDILPEMGLVSCHFGIESLDPYSCKIIGKGWGAKNHKIWIPKMVEKWKDKVSIRCSLIAGLGKEVESDWEETNKWFADSGAHFWFFNILDLQEDLRLSLFEQEPEKYGYKFNKTGHWYTDTMTVGRAMNWVVENKTSYMRKKYNTCWEYLSLKNLGFSHETLTKNTIPTLIKDFDIHNIKHINEFVRKYYAAAITY